jgi:hypothetical protein
LWKWSYGFVFRFPVNGIDGLLWETRSIALIRVAERVSTRFVSACEFHTGGHSRAVIHGLTSFSSRYIPANGIGGLLWETRSSALIRVAKRVSTRFVYQPVNSIHGRLFTGDHSWSYGRFVP